MIVYTTNISYMRTTPGNGPSLSLRGILAYSRPAEDEAVILAGDVAMKACLLIMRLACLASSHGLGLIVAIILGPIISLVIFSSSLEPQTKPDQAHPPCIVKLGACPASQRY